MSALGRVMGSQGLEDQLFARWLGASLVLHAGVVLLVTTQQLLAPPPPPPPLIKPVEVELLVAAPEDDGGGSQKRGLPNKETFVPIAAPEPPEEVVIEDKKPPQEKTETLPHEQEKVKPEPPREAQSVAEALKPDVPPPPSQDPGLDEQARQAMQERINQLAEAQRRREAIAKLSGVAGLRDRSAGRGSSSGDGEGSGMEGNALGIDPAWARALNEKIQPLWIVLPTLANKTLQVSVYVTLDAEGNVRDAVVRTSSGEPSLDSSAVRAVKKAQSLPLPSKGELKAAVLSDGFELAFNPRGLAP